MAKKKEDYLQEAQDLGLDVTAKNTVAEIQEAIAKAQNAPATEAKEAEETTEDSTEESDDEQTFAKAGKRSKKAADEAEEKEAKEERKAKIAAGEVDPSDEGTQKRGPVPKTRPRIERRGKKYREAAKKIDQDKTYSIADAAKLAVETSTTKFDATVEVHVRLNVDPTHADQNVRATTTLPHGTGKSSRVAVFAPSSDHAAAKEAGADIVGEEDFLEKLKKEELDFDILISTPQMMVQLGRFAKLLGPKGLMPNPKSGTVTKNVAQAVSEAKGGKVEFRIDKQAIVHLGVGKVSFGDKKVAENVSALLSAVKAARPAVIKGAYVEGIRLSTSMGPSVAVDIAAFNSL